MRVLIPDIHSRKNFDIVNILQNKYKLKLILCAPRDYKLQLRLIYLKKIYRLRSDNFYNFKIDFDSILSRYKYEDIVYFPVSDLNTRNFIKYTSSFKNKHLFYLLPSLKLFDAVNDKSQFLEIARKANVASPKSFQINELDEVIKKGIKIILKPKIGQGSVGIIKITDKDYDILKKIDLNDYEIQEYIVSNSHPFGVFFLCHNGKILDAYVHRRIRTFPRSGGVTVYSEILQNKELIDFAENITSSVKWNGFGMIEFMYDSVNNKWKCIEFNPRVWGSVLLAPYSGSNIIINYINKLFNKILLEPNKINYEAKVSWIYPFEILNLISGNLRIIDFVRLFGKNVSLISFTYSNLIRSTLYLIYFTINKKSIIRFLKKLKV